MSFETQKVSETEVLDTLGESVNVLVEDSGKIKRVPAKNLAPTLDDAIALVADCGLASPVTDENGAILTDENNDILIF